MTLESQITALNTLVADLLEKLIELENERPNDLALRKFINQKQQEFKEKEKNETTRHWKCTKSG